MTFNGQTFDVQIEAGIRLQTGEVFTTFQSIDPNTQLPPDILTGFLPPENQTGRGIGHVSYTIRPKSNLPTGTQIRNVALITFDSNPAISTDQVDPHEPTKGIDPAKQALNTLDIGAPSSRVTALAAQTPLNFTVSWSGNDDTNGSGVSTYDVYVSDNGAAYSGFVLGAAGTSAVFSGMLGHTYSFYSIAVDHVGNREPAPATADAITTTVALIPWQNPLDPTDVDDSGDTNPLDVLVLINDLNLNGSRKLSAGQNPAGPRNYLDVDADGFASPLDVLVVINFINRGNGEGESLASPLQPQAAELDTAVTDMLLADLSWFVDLESKRTAMTKFTGTTAVRVKTRRY